MCFQIHPLSLESFSEAQARDGQQSSVEHTHPRHGTAFRWAIWMFSPTWKDHLFYLIDLVREWMRDSGVDESSPSVATSFWSLVQKRFAYIQMSRLQLLEHVAYVGCILWKAEYFSLQGHFEVGKLSPSWTWGCFAKRKRRGLKYQRPRILNTVSTPLSTPSMGALWACRPSGRAW